MTFSLTSRVSELGREVLAGRPGAGRPMRYERLTRTGQGFIQPQLCHRLVAQAVLTSQFRNVQQQGREKGMHSQVLLPPLSFRPPPKTARSTLRFLSFCILASVLEFLGYPPRFRAWTGAGNAGGYNAPGVPEIEGAWSGWNIMSITGGENAGAFQSHWEAAGSIASATKEAGVWDRLLIKASRSNPLYGSSTTVMPASVNLPVILYLGISA